ncbi:MAG TPA: ABC transporter substrate-binding protein [Bacillota bacterium]
MSLFRNRRLRLIVVGLLSALFVLTLSFGCAGKQAAGPGSEKPKKGGNLTMGFDRETDTFDIYQMTWGSGQEYVYESLTTRDWDYKVVGSLAESWESTPDGKTWTFHLRKGTKWHDGTPFTSKDVKRYYEVMLDPKTAAANALDWTWIKSMDTPDDNTIVFHLDSPFPNLFGKTSNSYGSIMNPDAYAKYGPDGTKEYGTKIAIGTGPLKLKEWIPGDKVVFERNPDYRWGPLFVANKGPVWVDTVTFKTIPDAATRLAELETGNVQILANVPVEHYDRVAKIPNVEVFKEPAFGLGYLAFATDKKPFNDPKVRQAVNLAVDREALVKSVFFGLAQAAYGYLPPRTPEAYQDTAAIRYDVAAAKKLMTEAGYPNGFKATLATQNRTEHVRVAQAIQPMLEAIGIKTEIVQYDEAGYKDFLKAGKQELFMRQYEWDNADILQWFLYSRQVPYPGHSRWADRKTDELIDAAESAITPELRAQKYVELQKYLIEQSVWSPLWYPMAITAVRTDLVGGFKPFPGGGNVVIFDLWMKKNVK